MAFLTLFRIATGDNWNGIMKDTLREECEDDDDCLQNCCVSPYFAPLFFVVFVLMAQFVLVNVVVAVLMKHLEESHKQVRYFLAVNDALLLIITQKITISKKFCIFNVDVFFSLMDFVLRMLKKKIQNKYPRTCGGGCSARPRTIILL